MDLVLWMILVLRMRSSVDVTWIPIFPRVFFVLASMVAVLHFRFLLQGEVTLGASAWWFLNGKVFPFFWWKLLIQLLKHPFLLIESVARGAFAQAGEGDTARICALLCEESYKGAGDRFDEMTVDGLQLRLLSEFNSEHFLIYTLSRPDSQ